MNLKNGFFQAVGQGVVIVLLLFGFLHFLEAAATRPGHDEKEKSISYISEEEFLASPAAQLFQAGDFQPALEAIETLIQRYPSDPLLLRYRAMCLDRLGRSKEAIEIYQALLAQNPDHIPTRYFLGQAYFRGGDYEPAAKEWRKVIEIGKETTYARRAEQALKRFGPTLMPPELEVPRWNVLVSSGYEYDSNVVLKPDDKSLASSQDANANRFSLNTNLGYQAIAKPNFLLEGIYEFSQTLHDDGLDEFNFTFQEFGLDLRKRSQVKNHWVIWGIRYGLSPSFLGGDLFSLTNRWVLSADTRFSPRTRTLFFDRLAASNFAPDGSTPRRTSRDGFYQDFGVTHFWYPGNSPFHFFVHEEFNSAFTRGDNFDRLGNTTRVGSHLPWKQVAVDVSGGFALGGYPNFSSISSLDTDRRRDFTWDLYGSMTYFLTRRLSIRAFYRYVNSQNRNGFFEYHRHIGGTQLEFSQSF